MSISQRSVAHAHGHSGASYEVKVVLLLSLGFGLVGLDRFIINPLFPIMAKELGLNYRDLGLISSVLALTWGLASIWAGRLSDRIGHKAVIVPAVLLFSLVVGMTGLATTFSALILLRAMMGLTEGAYVPASIVATVQVSKPSRMGLNVGLQQMASPLIGLGLGPVIVTQSLKFLPSWHWVFALAAIPGFVLALLLAKVLRSDRAPKTQPSSGEEAPNWRSVLKYRNVVFATLGMTCWLSCMVILAAMLPSYLTDYLQLTMEQMGFVLAGLGLGSCLGVLVLPALSDRIGRKPVLLLALLLGFVDLVFLIRTPAEPSTLFALLFVVAVMVSGAVPITIGPLTSESVPARLASTATGVVVGLGEIVGGAVAPALAGVVAMTWGIQYILYLSLGAIFLGVLVTVFGIREPARQSARAAAAAPSSQAS